jgi:cell wall-associated NlpC family hydrolase
LALAAPSFMSLGASQATPSQGDLASAKARLGQLRHDFEVAVEKYDTVRQHLSDIRKQMKTTKVQVSDLRSSIASHEKQAKSFATQMYEGGSSSALEMVLSSKSLGQIESTLQYLRKSESTQAKIFERLAVDKRQLTLKLSDLATARTQVSKDVQRLSSLKSSIQTRMQNQQSEVSRLEEQIRKAAAARRARLAAQRRRAAAQQRQQQAAKQAAPKQAAAPAPAPPAPAPAPAPAPVSAPASSASGSAATAVQTALAQVGKPYVWGASGPDGFDCSGLTMYAWGAAGVSLPHSAASQYAVTQHVSTSSIQPGDLLFYYSPISHVSMYVGGGSMVEAPHTGSSVQVVPMRTTDLVGVGRP